ncbi:MAG: hypothetical protein R3F56_11305 [Planctomycetota bacterium]
MRKLFLVAALAPSILAQSSFTAPKIYRDSFAPGANFLPSARTKSFMQTWYHGQNLPVGTVVSQMGWRYDSGAASTGFTHTIEVVLDNTPMNASGFSNVFANNLSSAPTTFLPLQPVNWPAPVSGNLDPAMWIPGAAPFLFVGPHLIVQVDVQTEAAPRTLSGLNTDAINLTATSPYLAATGIAGCASSTLSVVPSVSGGIVNLDFRLSGGPANSQAVYFIGGENHTLFGAALLPFDLTFLGMTNCYLGVDPLLSLTLPTDGQGNALLQASLPNISGRPQTVFVQAAHSGSTPLGLVMTNSVGASVGDFGLMNYAYNWATFGPTAEFGPYTTSRGAVILMR